VRHNLPLLHTHTYTARVAHQETPATRSPPTPLPPQPRSVKKPATDLHILCICQRCDRLIIRKGVEGHAPVREQDSQHVKHHCHQQHIGKQLRVPADNTVRTANRQTHFVNTPSSMGSG
jgi:hypothetical protein